jgi:DNA-directed RNA polymerase specialized sigma24 family protein
MKTHQQDQETTEVLPDVSVAPEAPAKPSQLPLDFGEWYTDHRPTVYRYVRFRVATRETAEDVTSQVFMKALRSIQPLRPAQLHARGCCASLVTR